MKNGLVEKGDRFLVTQALPTLGLVYYAAPASGGFKCIVPNGTVLVADQDQRNGFPSFVCRPERYEELEPFLVPESERTENTIGYCLVCDNAHVGNALKLLDA